MVTLLGGHVEFFGEHGHAKAWPCHPARRSTARKVKWLYPAALCIILLSGRGHHFQ